MIHTWIAWATAGLFLIPAFVELQQREFSRAALSLLGAVLIGGIAHWRQRLLACKKEELAQAIKAHEAMLDKAFSELR